MFSVFVKQKATITENITFAISLSRIWSADWSKLVKNWKNDNEVTILRHDINVNFFWRFSVSFLKFSYWSKFHIKIDQKPGNQKHPRLIFAQYLETGTSYG